MQKAQLSESHRAGQLCLWPLCWIHPLQTSSQSLTGATGWWHQSSVCVVGARQEGSGTGLDGRDYSWGKGLGGWMAQGKDDDRSGGLEIKKQRVVRWEGGVNAKGEPVFVRVHWTQKQLIHTSELGTLV